MTVGELIDILEQLPKDLQIVESDYFEIYGAQVVNRELRDGDIEQIVKID